VQYRIHIQSLELHSGRYGDFESELVKKYQTDILTVEGKAIFLLKRLANKNYPSYNEGAK
jgi:hypothetical protein